MNTLLWVLQGILAVKLIATAVSHAFQHHLETMQEAIQSVGIALPLLYSAAGLMFLSGIVFLLPAILKVPDKMTPVLAAVVAVMMLVSVGLHIITRENPKIFANLVLFVLAAILSYGRWVLSPG